MEFYSGTTATLAQQSQQALFSYRFKVFVEHLGWQLDTETGVEKDQFDHDDTLYVIAKNEAEDVVGCARLLPTTLPYLLEEVFPELLNGQAPPKSDDIWELSRFTSLDLNDCDVMARKQFSAESSVALLKASIEVAKQHGAKKMISVSPIGVERLLRRAGFQCHRAGPPVILDGYPLVAVWIEL